MNETAQVLSLNSLTPETPGVVTGINCYGPFRQRLMDMGITPGAQVIIEGTAPLGDPLIVWVRGCRMALRRMEATQIMVIPCHGNASQAYGQWPGRGMRQGRHRHRRGQAMGRQ